MTRWRSVIETEEKERNNLEIILRGAGQPQFFPSVYSAR